ncbi:MAG TPA: hypothetical protein VIH28_01230 [Ignavibacteriaceae bacterium]
MKYLYKLLVLSAFGIFLSGCIEMHTVITVNKDGSGLIEENIFIGKEIIKMFKEFAAAFADSTQPQQEFNLFEEEKIKAKTSDYGEGIEFVSMENIVTDEREGYKAIYKFKDLNKVKVNQDPSDEMPMAEPKEGSEKTNEYVFFKFITGNPNRIVFKLPDETKKEEENTKQIKTDDTTATNVEADSSDLESMVKFMKDMKAKFEIRVDGKITNTNATHVDGNTVTLFDIDFAQLISDKEKLEEFKKFNPNSFEEVKKLVSGIPGIKVELNKEVYIEFE